MKIGFVMDSCIVCGGTLIPFQYVRELKKRGYDADVFANATAIESYAPTRPVSEIDTFNSYDRIIAVWWPQCDELFKFQGKKIQFVQGNDMLANVGEGRKQRCLHIRQDTHWDIMSVSRYSGEWVGRRGYGIVPNFVDSRFLQDLKLKRDIDILIEGNDESNKNIEQTIEIAKMMKAKKIVWLGRETHPIEGIEVITNPPQADIPSIYQRAKIFLKLSKTEGFCLPLIEAMASKCLCVTQDMGGNDYCEFGKNCLSVGEPTKDREDIIEAGYQTALNHSIENSTDKLIEYLKQ